MQVVNQDEYKKHRDLNSKDMYSYAVIRFMEEWARLMEAELANGRKIPECADEMGRLADTEGITGFMYGCAVAGLAKHWKHGDVLRRWHNKKVQIGAEGDKANETGGILNPALINFG